MTFKAFDCHLIGPFFHSHSGVGAVTRAYWQLMTAAGLKVGIYPSAEPRNLVEQQMLKKFRHFVVDQPHGELNFFRLNAQDLSGLNEFISRKRWRDSSNILIPMWETSRVPDVWRDNVRRFSAIIGATDFITDAFRLESFEGIVENIAPLLTVEEVDSSVPALTGIEKSRRVHVYSFAFASWSTRKNPLAFLELAKMHIRDSENSDDLFVLCASDSPRRWRDKRLERIFRNSQTKNFAYLPAGRNRDEQLSLIKRANTFVSVHRSEGLGLQLVESILLGTTVVSHIYSGPSFFLPNRFEGKFPHRLVEIGKGEYPNSPGQVWADFEIPEISKALNRVARNSDISSLQTKVSESFSVSRNADKLVSLISNLK